MEKDRNVIDNLAKLMDQNKRGIQYGLYSAAIVGLAIAVRSVRPFSKFTTPKSLPSSFVKKHIKLRGRVIEVDPSGVLKVDHFPIWSLPFRTSHNLLPVQIDSVHVMGLGTAWMQTILKEKNINFLPVSVEQDALSCIVLKEKKNVGIQLVSLGFATVQPIHPHPHIQKDELYAKYYKDLLAAEDKAESLRLGVWSDGQRPPTTIAVDTAKKIYGLLHGAVKTIKRMSSQSAIVR